MDDNRMYFQFKIHVHNVWIPDRSVVVLAHDEQDARKQLSLPPGTKAELYRTIPHSKLTGPLDAASHAFPR